MKKRESKQGREDQIRRKSCNKSCEKGREEGLERPTSDRCLKAHKLVSVRLRFGSRLRAPAHQSFGSRTVRKSRFVSGMHAQRLEMIRMRTEA
eukprot:4220760-Pleurochrysis_carterae.AAC.1